MKLPFFTLPSFTRDKRLKPSRDWSIILLISLACLVASVALNTWLFYEASNGALIGSKPAPQTSAFDQTALDRLSKVFSERAREQLQYKDGTHQFIDPSK